LRFYQPAAGFSLQPQAVIIYCGAAAPVYEKGDCDMLTGKVEEALNEQINREMYSAYLYMAMSAECTHRGLRGFANWFMVQYHEEMLHAMKLYEYINLQGGHVLLKALKQPPAEFESPLDMFLQTLEHEQFITRSINELMDTAIAEKDHATRIFLQWYVTEQVEEESNDNEIIAQLKIIRDDPQGLMMLDRELAARMTTVPTEFSKGVEAAMKGTAAG
jgi:ferritin